MRLVKDLDILPTEAEKQLCDIPKVSSAKNSGNTLKMYIESYGCQMNYADSEIVTSVMSANGYDVTELPAAADVIFINTCSIRDNAEQKVWKRLKEFQFYKKNKPNLKVGVLGCMAERLKTKFLEQEKVVDIVAGPDAYRDIPNLLSEIDHGRKAVNVFLSREETYADISPIRLNSNGVTAFVSIMRGCDNMCTFCVVPYTRGRERSRDAHSIVAEAKDLFEKGYREVTLLGQNVDSYKWTSTTEEAQKVNFAQLLAMVADVHPDLRVRFSTSHPKDINDEVLHTIKKYDNICNAIHLPAQSGNSRILALMNRTYDREWYLDRINAIKTIVGEDCGISTDIITGFCSETEEEHQDTITLLKEVKYHFAYMFTYSERPGTPAAKKFVDDIPLEIKNKRLNDIIDVQALNSLGRNKAEIGKVHKVLIEGFSKKSDQQLMGRNPQNVVIVFDKENYQVGTYVMVQIVDCTRGTLLGKAVEI